MRSLANLYRLWLAVCAGYLIGSILTADIAARLKARRDGHHIDLRTVGSGNPGGANAVSNLGKRWGIAVIFGDILKGVVAALAGLWLARNPGAYAASTAAVIGHCFPAWTNFNGGKGLGTAAGTTIVAFPAWFAVDVGLLAGTYKLTRSAATATYVAATAWAIGSIIWWRKQLLTPWGTPPTIGLPLYSVISAATICYKFLTEPPHMGDLPAGTSTSTRTSTTD